MLHKTSCLIVWEKNYTSQVHIRILQENCVSKKCNPKKKIPHHHNKYVFQWNVVKKTNLTLTQMLKKKKLT